MKARDLLRLRGSHEAPRVHRAHRRRGGEAACRAAPAPLGASYDCTYCARCLAPSAVSGLPQPLLLFSRLLLCPVCLLAAVNFHVAIQPRLDSEVSLLLTSTTRAVVATRADTCRTSNSIMSSLSDIFIAPVTSTSFFMVLLLLHYAMLVAYIWTSNASRLYVWS